MRGARIRTWCGIRLRVPRAKVHGAWKGSRLTSARQFSLGRANLREYRFDTTRSDEPAATRRVDGAVGQGLGYGVHEGEPDCCRIEPQGRHQTWDTPLDLPRSQ